MSSKSGNEPEAYAKPREWLEGKRQFVRVLYQLCGLSGNGWRSRRREPPVGLDREVVKAALNWHEEQHELRVVATRAAGIKLPIDDFAAEFELDAVEREIVELMLVAATDLTRDDGPGLQTVELVQLLTRGRQDKAQEYLPYFLPGSRLHSVVESREMLGSRSLSIEEDIVGRLLGVEGGQSGPKFKPVAAAESWDGDITEFLSHSGVVLGHAALESIQTLWGYVRRREVIHDKWGFGLPTQMPSGVCLLLHGPSGTGKTLTARCLCRALGRQPLIVSYPDLVSKWVGDTEKNTKAAFAEASKTGKALIFDEADAIFTRRTQVQTSSDRFANGHVNTLLMELERFPGIVILTTNHASVLDPALERRIQYKVYLGPPDTETRAAIWREHLPEEAPLAPDVDLRRLAEEFGLTGGQIANAVLAAASLAASRLEADSDTGQIAMADFEAAAQRELRGYSEAEKSGRMGF